MSIFLTLFGLLPSILQSVVAVEGAFKKTPGAVKKQIILNPVATAAKTLGAPASPVELAAASTLIDTTVASLNGVGLLGKPAPVKAAVVTPVKVAAVALKKAA
jgi:hypothetical protein